MNIDDLIAAAKDLLENYSYMSDRADGTQSKDQQRAWNNLREALGLPEKPLE